MHACNVIADIAVPLKNHVVFLYLFYSIEELRNVLIAEFESAEKYTRHCRTRVYFKWISLRGNFM